MGQTQTRKQKILGDVKKARRRRALLSTVIVAVIAVGIVAGVILLTPKPAPPSPFDGKPISALTNSQLTGVSISTLQSVGAGQGVTPLTDVGGSPLKSGSKNEFLYIGAEYCPYCAAERWGIIVALSKFGNFTNLTYMQSSSTDIYPNTATFSFYGATYQSTYNITFVSVETENRNESPLQPVNSQEQSLLNTYDPGGSIPFIDIGGQYVIQSASSSPGVDAGAQYSPAILAPGGSPLNWTQIGSQLNEPNSGLYPSVAQAIDGTANTIIKAICAVDGNNPSSLCSLTLTPPTQAPISTNNLNLSGLGSLSNLISSDARFSELS
jgi:Domain of unknown function (DUF929)